MTTQNAAQKASGSRWGLGRQPLLQEVHLQGYFEVESCRQHWFTWLQRIPWWGMLSSIVGSRKDPDCSVVKPTQGCDAQAVRSPLGSQEKAQSNSGGLMHF